jgi:hypothetical protein
MIIVGSVGAALAGSGDIAVRVFINVDNGSGQRVITFYKKVGSRDLSDAGWTQIGAPIVTAGVTTIAVTTTNILLGAFDQSQGATAGKWYGVLCKEINTGTVLNLDFSTWGNGDGMGGYPKHDANFRCVGIPSDVTGNDTNDTKWLDFVPGGNSAYPNKEKGWWAPGTLNNYAWVPDAAEFDIVGDLVLDADVALENWLTPSNSCLIGKWGVAGQRSYQLVVNTTGFLVLNWSPDGTTLVTATSTIPVGTINGQRMGVRASLDVSNGSSVWEVKFYTSRDYVNWSPLGASVLGAVPTSIFVSTQVVEIGSQQTGSANYATGRFFRAEIWNALPLGSNPPTPNRVLRVDFESAVEPFATFAAMGGQVVTLSRNPNGRKAVIVDRPMFVIGTDDYMECADHAQFDFAAANAFSVALALRGFNLTSALEQVFAAKSAGLAAQGWKLYKNSAGGANNTAFNIHDGVVGSYSGSKSSIDGTMLEVVGVRDTTLDKQRIFWDKVAGADGTDSTTATLANAEAVRIGRYSGAVTNYGEFELVGAAIWRKALTQAEVTALDTEFGTNV